MYLHTAVKCVILLLCVSLFAYAANSYWNSDKKERLSSSDQATLKYTNKNLSQSITLHSDVSTHFQIMLKKQDDKSLNKNVNKKETINVWLKYQSHLFKSVNKPDDERIRTKGQGHLYSDDVKKQNDQNVYIKGQSHLSKLKTDILDDKTKTVQLKSQINLSKEGAHVLDDNAKTVHLKSQRHWPEKELTLQDVENRENKSSFKTRKPCVVKVGRKGIPVSCKSPVFEAPPVPEDASVFKFDK